jgi:hypothetical protein
MKLHQLIYYSRNTVPGDDRALLQELRDIIKVSQRNNQRDGITGYLIFDRTWFLQILEGERDRIFATYMRIQRDARHSAVHMVQTREVTGRNFPAWSMGGSMRTPEKQEIYLRYGIGAQIDPTKLTGVTILSLAQDLQEHEVGQKSAQRKAG